MSRDRCEYGSHRKVRASICVIWDRTYRYRSRGSDIKHMHLCGTHANMIVAHDYDKGDKWTERTLKECAKMMAE